MSRSRETVGSPDSIFATRDWLDFRSFARATCVSRWRWRRSRRLAARRSFISMYSASSSVSRRKSLADPKRQPLASSRFRLSSRIVVFPRSPLCCLYHTVGRRLSFLAENVEDQHGVRVSPVDDPPRRVDVLNPQFVAPWTHRCHRSRMGHRKHFPLLEPSQQVACLDPGLLGQGRRFHLTVQPYQGFVGRAHGN